MKRGLLITAVGLLVIAFMITIFKVVVIDNKTSENLDYDRVRTVFDELPKADKPDEFYKIYKALTYREGLPSYKAGYKIEELNKAKANNVARSKNFSFTERGPANLPGRSRGMMVDPDDDTHQTWLVGTVGGGVWKTTNGGQSWINKTEDLPNLSVNTLAYCENQPDVVYAGTGEGWLGSAGFISGSGIFKSTDRGESWSLLESTANLDFDIINRIIVHPDNPDILLACTNNDPIFAAAFLSKILKSTDGGASWSTVYEGSGYVQQLIAQPGDFSTIYATVRGNGVIKSTDMGESWVDKSVGLSPDGRLEIDISPVNTNRLVASVEGNLTHQPDGGSGSDIYISSNAGDSWSLLGSSAGEDVDYFNTQGWYDNAIMAHPFDEDIFYVGGVGTFKITVQGDVTTSDPGFLGAVEDNTSFLGLVNFNSGVYYGDRIAVGETDAENFTSIEIRFGQGLSQMAHRFTIPEGSGAGVAAEDYTYQNYVEVPFEVWDIDADPPRQLMIAFRDQQDDGEFNLLSENTAAGDEVNHAREYMYINAIEYDASTPDSNIAQDGGHEFENMYFLWPFLAEGETWDSDNLPESKFVILWGQRSIQDYGIESVADVYSFLDGVNSWAQIVGETAQTTPHPDMHGYVPIIESENDQTFSILNSSDGGVYISGTSTDPGVAQGDWDFAGGQLNTTQFYAADKMPGENRYIGGAQDNGTWLTQAGESASATSDYQRALGGDGFGCVWHSQNPNLVLGSVQFMNINKSIDGGESWSGSTTGITDGGSFITKIENSHSAPDRVFTVGESGVWRSANFGTNWTLIPITENWDLRSSFNNLEISDATPDVVWAGNTFGEGGRVHVSTDGGLTFEEAGFYDEVELGLITGIATHPSDYRVAYLLFSYAEAPKILKTEDLGETWKDISGFAPSSTSTGFPDVGTLELIVMPDDPETLWVGTEIGLFESNDGGATWHILEGDLPRTSVWDMNINEDQLVVATHGRGIWTYTLPEAPEVVLLPDVRSADHTDGVLNITFEANVSFDSLEVYSDGDLVGVITEFAEVDEASIAFETTRNILSIVLVGYIGEAQNPYTSGSSSAVVTVSENPTALSLDDTPSIDIYPNPATDFITIPEAIGAETVKIYDLNGALVRSLAVEAGKADVRGIQSGLYVLQIQTVDGLMKSKLLID